MLKATIYNNTKSRCYQFPNMKATAGLDCLWRTVLAGRTCKKLQMTGLPDLQQPHQDTTPHQDHHGFHLFHLQHQERRQKSNEYKLGLAFLFFAQCKSMVLYSPQIQPKCNFHHLISSRVKLWKLLCVYFVLMQQNVAFALQISLEHYVRGFSEYQKGKGICFFSLKIVWEC